MKLVYVSTRLRAGYYGTEKFLDNLTTNLPYTDQIFIGYDSPLNKIFKDKGFPSYNSAGGFEPTGWKKALITPYSIVIGLIQFIRFYKIFRQADIIVSPASIMGESIFLIPWIRLLLKKPIVSTIHLNTCPDYIAKNLLLPFAKYSWNGGAMVFVSHSQMLEWQSKNSSSSNDVVIHNGIPINDFTPKADHKEGVVRLGFLGRIHKDKALDVLLIALSKLETDKKVVVDIAGEGEDWEMMQSLFKSLKFSKNVQINWLGFTKDIAGFLSKIDLLIYPSRKEGFALVPLEAWERGVPVLTSDIAPFIEAKKGSPESEQKLISKLQDADDLLNKIKYFISEYKTYTSAENQILLHDFAKQNYSLEAMTKKYIELFNQLSQKK